MDSKKNYRLATDENGSPFVLNSKGSIDFGYITEEMNLAMMNYMPLRGILSFGGGAIPPESIEAILDKLNNA